MRRRTKTQKYNNRDALKTIHTKRCRRDHGVNPLAGTKSPMRLRRCRARHTCAQQHANAHPQPTARPSKAATGRRNRQEQGGIFGFGQANDFLMTVSRGNQPCIVSWRMAISRQAGVSGAQQRHPNNPAKGVSVRPRGGSASRRGWFWLWSAQRAWAQIDQTG